jgi:glycosyltransferase involved in cell wall biosynthesis
MKIIFVISSRMPTEKAYGVTMRNTSEALVQQGIDNEIWSITDSLEAFNPLRPFNFSPRYISRLRKCFGSTFKPLRTLAYFVNTIRVSTGSTKRLVREKKSLVVLREPILLMLVQGFSFPKRHFYLLELHHLPSRRIIFLINIWRKFRFFEIATISHSLHATASNYFFPSPNFTLPMAASSHFRAHELVPHELVPHEEESFVYYGKLMSSGHDNGILETLRTIKGSQTLKPPLKFTLIGFSEDEKNVIEKKLDATWGQGLDLLIEPHIDNQELPLILSQYSASIIPYPNTRYNNERFPLKLVELAALGIPLIVSDIPGLRDLLPEDCAIWFEFNDPPSLIRAINILISEPWPARNERIQRLRGWAQSYSYENRASLLAKYAELLEESGE